MKARQKAKTSSCRIEAQSLTLGDLIAATYDAYGEQRARKILQLAIDSHVVRFKQPSDRSSDISPPRGA